MDDKLSVEGVFMIAMSGWLVLIVKILYDILTRNSKGGGMPKHCEEHDDCVKRLQGCEKCLTGVKTKQATFEERSLNIIRELNEGNEKFEKVTEDISNMKGNLQVIAHSLKVNINNGKPSSV